MSELPNIRPCPYCDEEENVYTRPRGMTHAVECGECYGMGPLGWTERQAIERWNTRPEERRLTMERAPSTSFDVRPGWEERYKAAHTGGPESIWQLRDNLVEKHKEIAAELTASMAEELDRAIMAAAHDPICPAYRDGDRPCKCEEINRPEYRIE